jgi:hypothetical protein
MTDHAVITGTFSEAKAKHRIKCLEMEISARNAASRELGKQLSALEVENIRLLFHIEAAIIGDHDGGIIEFLRRALHPTRTTNAEFGRKLAEFRGKPE